MQPGHVEPDSAAEPKRSTQTSATDPVIMLASPAGNRSHTGDLPVAGRARTTRPVSDLSLRPGVRSVKTRGSSTA